MRSSVDFARVPFGFRHDPKIWLWRENKGKHPVRAAGAGERA